MLLIYIIINVSHPNSENGYKVPHIMHSIIIIITELGNVRNPNISYLLQSRGKVRYAYQGWGFFFACNLHLGKKLTVCVSGFAL